MKLLNYLILTMTFSVTCSFFCLTQFPNFRAFPRGSVAKNLPAVQEPYEMRVDPWVG